MSSKVNSAYISVAVIYVYSILGVFGFIDIDAADVLLFMNNIFMIQILMVKIVLETVDKQE